DQGDRWPTLAWLSNYIPRRWDKVRQPQQRGIFPRQITSILTGYADLVASDRETYFKTRKKTGDSPKKILALRVIASAGRLLGLSCGAVTSTFFLALKKAGFTKYLSEFGRPRRFTHDMLQRSQSPPFRGG